MVNQASGAEARGARLKTIIPLAIVLLMIAGGIFVLIWFCMFYHFDSIDDQITDKVDFYSHWQIKKTLDKTNPQLRRLMETKQLTYFWPENFEEKLNNSSEFAIAHYNGQFIFIFKPLKSSVYFPDVASGTPQLVINSIGDEQLLAGFFDKVNSLSKSNAYRSNKKWDFSPINIYFAQPKALFNDTALAQYAVKLNTPSFWQVKILNNGLIISSNYQETDDNCHSDVNLANTENFQYYIHSLSTQNTIFDSLPPIFIQSKCVDLAFFANNWAVIINNMDKSVIKESVSSYLATKYPRYQNRILPDSSAATHLIADTANFPWIYKNNEEVCSAAAEEYYLSQMGDSIVISSAPLPSANATASAACSYVKTEPKIKISDPDHFIFDAIQLVIPNRKMLICID